MQNTVYMLFGAALVCLGILASALADRIRGLRVSREGREVREGRESARERSSRVAAASASRGPIQVVEAAEPLRKPAVTRRAPETKTQAEDGGNDVIAALVASGYKKPVATEATWACSAAERATVETWVAAALRRCARGGMS